MYKKCLSAFWEKRSKEENIQALMGTETADEESLNNQICCNLHNHLITIFGS